MTLGSRIQQFRKEHNMSQGDLADALDISRQSVSKWETDTATPDLDKLLKLSEIFGVTLDELVKGAPPESNFESASAQSAPEPPNPIPVTIQTRLLPKQITGIILLCMTFLIVLACSISGYFLAGVIYCIPFLVCGLICMFIEKRTGVWCGWFLVILLEFFTRFATGVHWNMIFHAYAYTSGYWHLTILSWVHFAIVLFVIGITIGSFRTYEPAFTVKLKRILIGCAAVYLFLHLPFSAFILSMPGSYALIHGNWWIISMVNIITTIGRLILFTILTVHALAWQRQRKAQ